MSAVMYLIVLVGIFLAALWSLLELLFIVAIPLILILIAACILKLLARPLLFLMLLVLLIAFCNHS